MLAFIGVDKTAIPSSYQSVLFTKNTIPANVEFIPMNFENDYLDHKLASVIGIILLSVVVFGVILDFLQHKSPPSSSKLFVAIVGVCLLGIGFLFMFVRKKNLQQKLFLQSEYRYGLYLFNDAMLLYNTEKLCSWWSIQSIISIKHIVTGHKPAAHNLLITYRSTPHGGLEYFYLPESLEGQTFKLEKKLKGWLVSKNISNSY